MQQYNTNAICPKCKQKSLITSKTNNVFLTCTQCNKDFQKKDIKNFASKEVFEIYIPLMPELWNEGKIKLFDTKYKYNIFMLGYKNIQHILVLAFDILRTPYIPTAKELNTLLNAFEKDFTSIRKTFTKKSALNEVNRMIDSVKYCRYKDSAAAKQFLSTINDIIDNCKKYPEYSEYKEKADNTIKKIENLPLMPMKDLLDNTEGMLHDIDNNIDIDDDNIFIEDEDNDDYYNNQDYNDEETEKLLDSIFGEITNPSKISKNFERTQEDIDRDNKIFEETCKLNGINTSDYLKEELEELDKEDNDLDLGTLSNIIQNATSPKEKTKSKSSTSNSKAWNDDEDKILKDNYKTMTFAEISNLIPNRSEGACKARAKKLKLRK